MSEQVYYRKTMCPLCGRVTDAYLTELDNGRWRFNPHQRLGDSEGQKERAGEACGADTGVWRLTGQYPKAGGSWGDNWKRPNGEGL